MSDKQPNSVTNLNSGSSVAPGGYHSRGVPGEEAAVRKRMRLVKLTDQNKFIRRSQPLKGGVTAESTSTGRLEDARPGGNSAQASSRAVYALARQNETALETPVFHAGATGEDEAIVVFTDLNKAILYLQVAGWKNSHEPRPLSSRDLGVWLDEAHADGIHLVAVDPDRQAHLAGEPQPVLFLNEQVDRSGESLYREIMSAAQT